MGATKCMLIKNERNEDVVFCVHFDDPKMDGSELIQLTMRRPSYGGGFFLSRREAEELARFLNEVIR